MAHTTEKSATHIDGIDGLRAIAVLMVIAYHLRLPVAKGGLLGVTVFFVISGYLITHILMTEIEKTETIDLKNFWIRRFRRLLPAVFTMLALLLPVSALCNRVLFTKARTDALSVILGYNNWWQIFHNVSYFENAGIPSPLTHCWSLAIETQFYLVYPLLLLLLSKCKKRKLVSAGVTLGLTAVSATLMWVLFNPATDPSRVYYGTDTRAFSLLIGAFLALILPKETAENHHSRLYDCIGMLSLCGLLFMMYAIEGYSSFLYKGGQLLTSVLAAFVLLCLLQPQSILGRILSIPPLRWIGERSYGIYLWHYPVILLLSNGVKTNWMILLAELAITAVLSELSYRLVETPIRHGIIRKSLCIFKTHPETKQARKEKQKATGKRLAVGCCALLPCIAALLCVIFVPGQSVSKDMEELQKQAQTVQKMTEEKKNALSSKSENTSGDPAASDDSDSSKGTDTPKDTRTDEEIFQSLHLLLLGDSIALGSANEFYAAFPNSICDASVSRQATEALSLYPAYVNEHGWNGDGVILALGSNGLLYDTLPRLRKMMGPDLPLFIFTVRAPHVSWQDSNNAEIRDFVNATANTYLIDWYAISNDHNEYFVSDDTHPTQEAHQIYINCIKEAVLKVYRK